MTTTRTLYLAGPMRGKPLYNFPAFDRAAQALCNYGYRVINPAHLDRQTGFDENTDTVDADFVRAAIRRDLNAIAHHDCDGLAVLPGWETSEGTKLEIHLADFIGIPVKPVGEWLKLCPAKAEGAATL